MVRVRFAPSPTGYLHLGNARTALFNYIYAKHTGGKLILRVEDTDKERSKKEYEEMLIDDLKWLGIQWDEGPDVGGEHAPYRQSERDHIYKEYIEKLKQSGHIYKCFCTPEELEEERKKALAEGKPPRYSGKCRNLSEEEIKKLEEEGKPYTWRFRVPDGEVIVFEDLIKGVVEINVNEFGDFVIVRSDGSPVYNFVVVVDDALMEITHVIRGEDHLSNTPKQILIYRALGFKEPKFAHLPIILGEDKSKLSKRHGSVSVRAFREDGYVSEAMFNGLALLGWHPKKDTEVVSKEEIIEEFDIEDVHNAPAVFDRAKLKWLNGVYIREILDLDDLTNRAIPFFEKFGYKADFEYYKKVLNVIRDSLETLNDIKERAFPFFVDEFEYENDAKEILENEESINVIKTFYEKVSNLESISQADFKAITKEIQKELKVKGKALFMPIRVALTGKTSGVDISLLVEVIGKDRVLKRIEKALKTFGG
ncbi:MAG: glutamate--tRNA ligase [Hydrogenothermus sp.]|nr:MAG: glutamate--tRNA ligase [Hydrogenothermus sp.]